MEFIARLNFSPFLQAVGKGLDALGSYAVVAAAAAAGGFLPDSVDQVVALQAVQGRVEGALFEGEVAAASLVDLFDNLVAVHGFRLQEGQQEGFGVAFQLFLSIHGLTSKGGVDDACAEAILDRRGCGVKERGGARVRARQIKAVRLLP